MADVAKKQAGMTDMTTGNPAKLIFFFSVPLLIGNMFQQLYNMVDSLVVGRFAGEIALAAVGTGFPVVFMMTSFFMGIGMGALVMISQYYGAKDFEQVSNTVNTMYTTVIVGVVPLTILSLLIADPLLRFIKVPENTMADAKTYLIILFLGMIGTLGFNINSGIMQGLGDSKTPLLFLTLACFINIVLDLVFVVNFHWGVAGVAIATVIAQIFSWVFGIFYINRKYDFIHISPFKLRFVKPLFVQIIRLGIPSGIQQALFSVGSIAVQSLVNSFGPAFMAGFNVANKLDTFAFLPIQSITNAVTTYVGQNIGAGKLKRVHRGTISALVMCVLVSIVLGGGVILFGSQLMGLFTPSQEVIASGCAYLNRVLPFYVLLALLFVFNSVMRGAGEMVVPMASSILSLWAARVPASYLITHFFGRDNMFFSYAFGWAIGAALTMFFYFKGGWKHKAIPYSQYDEAADIDN